MIMNQAQKGFTLIEIIVVMGIIGILAAAATLGFSTQQASARDTRRFTDVRNISDSLEFYFEDNGKYAQAKTHLGDTSVGANTSNTYAPSSVSSDWAADSNLRGIVTGGYIDALPKDPVNSAAYYYRFVLNSDLRNYLIEAIHLEKKAGNQNNGTTFTLKSNN